VLTLPPGVLPRRLVAEGLGTGLLVTVVVGSGIAAQRLSAGEAGLQLLENALVTALGLAVLVAVLAPVSGGHLNPVVTVVLWIDGRGQPGALVARDAAAYVVVQTVGAVGGCVLANAMYAVPVTDLATADRDGWRLLLGELVATAGLVLVVVLLLRTGRAALAAPAVGAYIGAAYWFTSSTSFANPAVTVGRMFSDTFAGIAPASAPGFVLAQVAGGAVGLGLARLLVPGPVPQEVLA
jgi:glycerol uptake facilitator-like aquaporin